MGRRGFGVLRARRLPKGPFVTARDIRRTGWLGEKPRAPRDIQADRSALPGTADGFTPLPYDMVREAFPWLYARHPSDRDLAATLGIPIDVTRVARTGEIIGRRVLRPADPLAHDDTGAGVKLAVALAAASLGMNVAMIALLFWR